jgi:DNA-binding winged helix-turn-helix (wHTH) protein
MDVAKRAINEPLLTTADLAARADFVLGELAVSPSTRTLRGPAGSTDLEPRVMQVLAVLADASGQVVTRETLFSRCWGSPYVGDDSLNRAVAALRRAIASVGGRIDIETIPRTGYRLAAAGVTPLDTGNVRSGRSLSRRGLIAGAAGAAIAGGSGLWWIRSRETSDARFNQLMEVGEAAIRTQDANSQIVGALEEAAAMRPDSARAWGLLAFFAVILAQLSEPKVAAPLIDRAQVAASRAFAIDRREPNALLAMLELQGSTLDWITRDRRLREIIAIDPTRIWAITELVLLLQAAGLTRDSQHWNERALLLVPLSFDYLTKRALKYWIVGRVDQADKVIDQVRALYPDNPWVCWARFLIFAMTGRAEAAEALLNSNRQILSDPIDGRMWRTGLAALKRPGAVPISQVRGACFGAAKITNQVHGQGVMILSALGDVDDAYTIADGILLGRGPIVRRETAGSAVPSQEALERTNMQWLFTPPCAAMRSDSRFTPLCDSIGLSAYWRGRGVRPDYQVYG